MIGSRGRLTGRVGDESGKADGGGPGSGIWRRILACRRRAAGAAAHECRWSALHQWHQLRQSDSEASINKSGRFQTGLAGLEAEVKDSRFADGWGYFNFGSAPSLSDAAAPLAGDRVATCIDCHTKNTAVERTFVQFYPTLLEI